MLPFEGFFLELLNTLTFGRLGRAGAPDPEEQRSEQRRRAEEERVRFEGVFGRVGTAATTLRPSGKVEVAGASYEALSDGGFLERGTEVEVIGSRGAALLVRARST